MKSEVIMQVKLNGTCHNRHGPQIKIVKLKMSLEEREIVVQEVLNLGLEGYSLI